jgi:peptide/nickel transport system permease protein
MAVARRRRRNLGALAWKQRMGVLGLVLVATATLVAFLAPAIAPHDPFAGELVLRLLPPIWMDGGNPSFLLGTDQLGRDTLSRIMYGARVSLTAGSLAVVIATVIGVSLGVLAGYRRGWLDRVVSMVVNVVVTFPFLLLALVVVGIVGPNFRNIIIVLGLTAWPVYARVLRNETLSLRERDYVLAARALGCTDGRIVTRHLLPNLVGPIVVLSSLEVAQMILAESFLGFLGLGVQPPEPSWGGMLGDARNYVLSRWWLAAFPGLAIWATALGINLLGDGLRDVLDPRR